MRGKWSRLALGLLMVAVLTGAAVLVGVLARSGSSAARGQGLVAKSGDPDAKGKASVEATASVEKGPASVTAAEEAYAERAYPADEVPVQLTLNAQQAWTKLKGKSGNSNGKAGGGSSSARRAEPRADAEPAHLLRRAIRHVRTHHRNGHRSGVLAVEVPRVDRCRRRRDLADDESRFPGRRTGRSSRATSLRTRSAR